MPMRTELDLKFATQEIQTLWKETVGNGFWFPHQIAWGKSKYCLRWKLLVTPFYALGTARSRRVATPSIDRNVPKAKPAVPVRRALQKTSAIV